MKIDIKKVDGTRRELKFEIPKERVAQKLGEVYAEIGRTAKIKGFRPGKAPRNVLEIHHGQFAREEVIKKLIPEVYQEGVKKENLSPLDLPEIHDVTFKDGIISFTATLDIRPEIPVKNYKGIPVKRKGSQVSEEELNKALEFVKKGQKNEEAAELNDAFARGLGYPTLDDFKKALLRQLEIDKDRYNRLDIENQVVEYLLRNTKFTVPSAVVSRHLEHRLEEAKNHLKSQGMSDEDIRKKEEELRAEFKQTTERDVKLYLILEEIAKKEQMDTKSGESLPGKVMEFLLKEAQWVL